MRTYLFSVGHSGSPDELELINASISALFRNEKEYRDEVPLVSKKEKDREDFQCIIGEIRFTVDTVFFATDDAVALKLAELLGAMVSNMVAEEGFSGGSLSAELKEGFLSVPGGGYRAFTPTRTVSVFTI